MDEKRAGIGSNLLPPIVLHVTVFYPKLDSRLQFHVLYRVMRGNACITR